MLVEQGASWWSHLPGFMHSCESVNAGCLHSYEKYIDYFTVHSINIIDNLCNSRGRSDQLAPPRHNYFLQKNIPEGRGGNFIIFVFVAQAEQLQHSHKQCYTKRTPHSKSLSSLLQLFLMARPSYDFLVCPLP